MNKIRDTDSLLIDQNENSLCYTLFLVKKTWMTVKTSVFLAQQ